MRPDPMTNLLHAGVTDWTRWLAKAAELGADDQVAGLSRRTGKEVVAALGIGKWRHGHVRYLQRAYAAGWWHIEMLAK